MNPTPRTILLHTAALCALLAAGCQATAPEGAARPADNGGNGPTATPGATGDVPRERPSDTVIVGEATYRERIKMPPGAALHVELVTLGTTPRVLARVVKPDVAGPPIPFSLPYAAKDVDVAAAHGLRAELVGPDGERWFATSAPVPLVPGNGMAVELVLRRSSGQASPAGGTPARGSPTATLHWECGDLGVMSRPVAGATGLRLDANGATWRSGTGGARFDLEGTTARLTLPGEPVRDCVRARQASAWNEAALRGLAFRAVGNEPGWFVEVGPGERAVLKATLDYGERQLVVDNAQRTPDGYRGTANGEPVVLSIRKARCTDGMSGQQFEATATLRVGDGEHTGCGAFFAD